MELYPAIDLRNGDAVRLLQGDYDKMTVYSHKPLELALSFQADGAKNLHLVDLDGAKDGNTPNFQVIEDIVKATDLFVEVGGGIRNMDTVRKYLEIGVGRVIIGTAAITDPRFLQEAVAAYGEKIAVGVDVKGEYVATHGWTQVSGENIYDFCAKLQNMGVKTIICTDISKDGAMQGVNLELYEKLLKRVSMEIIASGGVTDINDLELLSKAGVAGAIMGKSLYTGSIDLKGALEMMGKSE